MSESHKKDELKLLNKMKKVDSDRKEKEEIKNTLESSIYSLRESVFGESNEAVLKIVATRYKKESDK